MEGRAMPTKLKCRLVFLTWLLVLCAAGRGYGATASSRWLVTPELLEEGKLEILWEDKLPIQKTEELESMSIVGERIYALSSRNYMICLDRNKGKTIFSRSVAAAGLPVGRLVPYEDELMFVLGNRLVEMNGQTGKELRAKTIEIGLACPGARNSSFYYLSGKDRRLHVLHAENGVEFFEVAVENDPMITSIAADEDFVVFGTDAGNVVSILPDRPRRLWQFDAGGAIAGPIVREGRSLFFASKDTNIYRVDVFNLPVKELVWKYQTAGVPETSPHVTQKVVYQYIRGKGVTAIDRESGKGIWSLGEGVELLAEAKGKSYVISKNGTLAVMDNVRGKKLYSVNFRQVKRYAVNTADSKIYIADKSGRIACVQPAD